LRTGDGVWKVVMIEWFRAIDPVEELCDEKKEAFCFLLSY
jgi:hypothetical protein